MQKKTPAIDKKDQYPCHKKTPPPLLQKLHNIQKKLFFSPFHILEKSFLRYGKKFKVKLS